MSTMLTVRHYMSCSSTASPDGSAHSYPSLISRPQPAFRRLQCAVELRCKDIECILFDSTRSCSSSTGP